MDSVVCNWLYFDYVNDIRLMAFLHKLLRGVEIIDRKAKIIASNIFTITPGLPFRLSFL